MDAKKHSEKIATTINMVFLSGPGTISSVSLPQTLIDDTNYTINIYPQDHRVEVSWMSKTDLRTYASQIVTSNVTGNLVGLSGTINITNTDGEISIEN